MSSQKTRYAVFKQLEGKANEEEIVLLPGESLSVGRGEAADYVIGDSRLSRVHFRLDYHEFKLTCRITDLKSRNGILVNERKIDHAFLTEGDKIRVGREVYAFCWRDDNEFDDLEGETEVVSNLIFCEHCGASVGPISVRKGAAKTKDGSYLCADCSLILNVGSKSFGNFTIQEKLGQGKAGLVYKALDQEERRVVALKVMRPGPDVKDRHILRFLQEAATITKLRHPNIIEVYGAQRYPNGYFLVLEYFEGDDLAERVRWAGPMNLDLLTRIGIQVSSAVSFAGKAKIVHRDIKPANILFNTSKKLAKLSDFGLARQIKTTRRRITREGEGLGTPTYMPPEQMRHARDADHRADIYSVGASLFHLATGRLPITATSYQEFVSQLLNQDAPLITDLRPEAPASLAQAIGKCMQKKAEDRYQDASELEIDLRAVRKELGLSEID
ncbi:MAG: serine/threonine-protein kinase [Planctomycetota bacterium]|nr:serine/threonine-protein kinase [Planctomycetota bacterium]